MLGCTRCTRCTGCTPCTGATCDVPLLSDAEECLASFLDVLACEFPISAGVCLTRPGAFEFGFGLLDRRFLLAGRMGQFAFPRLRRRGCGSQLASLSLRIRWLCGFYRARGFSRPCGRAWLQRRRQGYTGEHLEATGLQRLGEPAR